MRLPTACLASLATLCAAACLALPSSAAALELEIVNESGRPASEVFITVAAGGGFDVPGMTNDEPKPLSEIAGAELTIDELVSGRVYVAYGAGVGEGTTLTSPTRFDWAELTVTPSASDVANLTAVDQFGIGMRLETLDAVGSQLEWLGAANSNTIFAALQSIPGGPQATVRGPTGNVIRVISPNKSSAYPDLGEYVRSMSGKTISLATAFFGTPFTTSRYTGTFAADGSIVLTGTTDPSGAAPATIAIQGADLIADIYTGGSTPNNLEGAIYRDLLAGFSTGFWDGRYGNDALGFCDNAITTGQGSWCPDGFNLPAFGDAKTSLQPFPTCEQYAAVINQYSDVYGNPYSDAAKKVTVGLDQPGSGGEVETLRLTILPDSGNATPASAGNPNCGAAPAPAPPPGPARARVRARFLATAKLRGRTAKIARLNCSVRCGQVKVVAKRGKQVIARSKTRMARVSGPVKVRLTAKGRKLMKGRQQAKVKVTIWAAPDGQATERRSGSVRLLR